MSAIESTNVSIYGLVDPRSGMVRYVGKAADPESRLRQHLQPAQVSRYKSKKNSWIKSLQSKGLVPELFVLQEVSPESANEAERQWISCYKGWGGELITNGTDGGDGGAITDPDAKARIRAGNLGRKDTEETKAKRRASQRAAFASPEFRDKRRQIALDLNYKPPANYGESNTMCFFTEKQVVEIRIAVDSGETIKSLANKHNTSYTTIHRIVTGETWKNSPGPLRTVTPRKTR